MAPPKRSWTASEKREVGARQCWRCAHCKELLPAAFECDHVFALHNGGPDTLDNAEALCPRCHSAKTLRERIAFEAARKAAILCAKAEAKAQALASPPTARAAKRNRPLSGKQTLLDAHLGTEVLENRFLSFAYVPNSQAS